jgi:hypothetical protein
MRSAPLMAGLLTIAAATGGLPFSLHEIGASAGLMLVLDRYEHCLGGAMSGAPGTSVRIEPGWEGGAPPAAAVRVTSRRGCAWIRLTSRVLRIASACSPMSGPTSPRGSPASRRASAWPPPIRPT